jgi:hypothetical protein
MLPYTICMCMHVCACVVGLWCGGAVVGVCRITTIKFADGEQCKDWLRALEDARAEAIALKEKQEVCVS